MRLPTIPISNAIVPQQRRRHVVRSTICSFQFAIFNLQFPLRNFLLWALLLPAVGCLSTPYRAGNRELYPADIRTVYVPMVDCDSLRRGLGERLTEAICKEIEAKTPYKVVGNSSADSVLTARVVSDHKAPVLFTRNTDPRDLQLSFRIDVTWVNRRGDVVGQTGSIAIPPPLVTINQSVDYVPEFGQSLVTQQQEAIKKTAKQIVEMMEMPW